MNRVGAREIRGMLQARGFELIGRLFPGYRITTPVFTPLNPTRADTRPGSFVVWTSGPAIGGFNEYSPKGPQASGDIIDLIAYVHRSDRSFALRFAKDFLGLQQMTETELAARKIQARQAAAQSVAVESEKKIAGRRRAFEIFSGAQHGVDGTLAELYLARARKIPLRAIANREDDLRFAAKLEWWKGAKFDGPKFVHPGPKMPAMVAALRNEAGELTGVHCTFLRADGAGKADVPEPKLMRGDKKGSAIRLTRGPSNLTLEEAAAHGVLEPLIVAEGIENGLSVATIAPEARVWAAGDMGNIMTVPVWHPAIDHLTIAADNDGSAKAADQLAAIVEHLSQFGKRVTVMRPPAGTKDFNDLLQGDD